MISRRELIVMYAGGKSMQDIANQMGCSLHKIKYWMEKYKIPIRSISEAIYLKRNPNGDPFKVKEPTSNEDYFLRGLGLGLYWGEGTKANRLSVRLGNSDPALIKNFIKFLIRRYGIDKNDLRFGLQLFSDINPQEALKFWQKELDVSKDRFQKVIITPSRGLGTYRKKVKYGVLTVYYHNRKLRDLICEELKVLGFCG